MTCTVEHVVHLVKGPLGVQAHSNQPVFIAVLHGVGRAPEVAVLLDAYRKHPVVSTIRIPICLIGQHVTHLRLVRIGRHQIDIIGTRLSLGPFKIVPGMEIDVITLLWKTPAGLTVNIDQYIVVELSVVKERAAGSGIGVSGVRIQDKPMQHRQRISQARVIHYGPAILRGIQQIIVGREPRFASGCICSRNVPADHMSGTERGCGDSPPVDTVAVVIVAAQTIIH